MFRARLSAFFLAANFFSVMRLSMIASSSLVKGRKVGRLFSDSFSAWLSDMLALVQMGTNSGSVLRYHLQVNKTALVWRFPQVSGHFQANWDRKKSQKNLLKIVSRVGFCLSNFDPQLLDQCSKNHEKNVNNLGKNGGWLLLSREAFFGN